VSALSEAAAPEVPATVHPGRCYCRKFTPGHAPGLHDRWSVCTGDVIRGGHDPATCPACKAGAGEYYGCVCGAESYAEHLTRAYPPHVYRLGIRMR
jgi:hypothetical protein